MRPVCLKQDPWHDSTGFILYRTFLLIFTCHALRLTRNPSFRRLAKRTLFPAMQHVGFLLSDRIRPVCHLRYYFILDLLEVVHTIYRRLYSWVILDRIWRLRGILVRRSKSLDLSTDGVFGWLRLAHGSGFTGLQKESILIITLAINLVSSEMRDFHLR